jgi:RNA polymerase sigma-70 factor (ECF subfamily)
VSSPAESDLIARCRRGEAEGWDELFSVHYAPAARFIYQLSPELSREDADEICQETFLSVIKNLATFQGGSRLQTWIFRIASNKARDFREKQQAAKRGGGAQPLSLQAEDAETGLSIDPASPLPGPDTLLANREGMLLLGEALGQLGQPCREIIELRYFADLSYDEISKSLELNEKTVSSRLSKCLDRLEKVAADLFCRKKTSPFPV